MKRYSKSEIQKTKALFNLYAEAFGLDKDDLQHELLMERLEGEGVDEKSRPLLQHMKKMQETITKKEEKGEQNENTIKNQISAY